MKSNQKIIFLMTFLLLLLTSVITSNYALGEKDGGGYLAFAEQMPQPVGGLAAIYKKISYPEMARQAGVEGKVYVVAFIDENGTVNDVKVLKGIGAGCDEAAIKAIKNTKFKPAMNKGKPVKVKFSLAITFKLK